MLCVCGVRVSPCVGPSAWVHMSVTTCMHVCLWCARVSMCWSECVSAYVTTCMRVSLWCARLRVLVRVCECICHYVRTRVSVRICMCWSPCPPTGTPPQSPDSPAWLPRVKQEKKMEKGLEVVVWPGCQEEAASMIRAESARSRLVQQQTTVNMHATEWGVNLKVSPLQDGGTRLLGAVGVWVQMV
jgi:hypothetical protein